VLHRSNASFKPTYLHDFVDNLTNYKPRGMKRPNSEGVGQWESKNKPARLLESFTTSRLQTAFPKGC
jgi:hypothetical protein